MKILFLLPYPLKQAPSQRFRVEAYFNLLHKSNIDFDTNEFLDKNAYVLLYKGGSGMQKFFAVTKGFGKRFVKVLFGSKNYDYIFIHREAAPLGPPFFEWILAKIMRKKIIFDFDDAIWIPAVTNNNKIALYLKAFWKVKHITSWSHKVSVGNAYLANWAKQFQDNIVINPTCVDMETKFNKVKENIETSKLVIGWTGSHSTLKYLDLVYPVLQKLEKEFDFIFLVICNKPPLFSLKSLQFKQWNEETEIEDLLLMDIGLMPLLPDAWSEGKCGFKLIQYLSLGIPAIASPVGVNKKIVDHGRNGFLCSNEKEWYDCIKTLLKNQNLRFEMGTKGRHMMEQSYSLASNEKTFLSLFSE